MIASQGRFAPVTVLAALLLMPFSLPLSAESSWIAPGSSAPAHPNAIDPEETASLGSAEAIDPSVDPLHGLVHEYAAMTGVPAGLAHAIVTIESRYNPAARNGPHYGLMQINVATARAMGFSGEASELLEPATNLRFGMAYLAGAYKLAGGDTCGTIMRYQGGHRATRMSAAAARYCERAKSISAASR
jgi:soluble lytic murein transglycosylase-like protein